MKKLMLTLLVLFCGVAHAECKTGNVYSDIECFEKQLKIDKAKMNKIYNKLASNLIVKGKPVWKIPKRLGLIIVQSNVLV